MNRGVENILEGFRNLYQHRNRMVTREAYNNQQSLLVYEFEIDSAVADITERNDVIDERMQQVVAEAVIMGVNLSGAQIINEVSNKG